MDPGDSESGITNQKAGAGGKENNPRTNQRELRRETDGDRGSSSEQLPGVSVLTLWTPACHCHCGTKHRTAAQMHAHRWPGQQARPPPGRALARQRPGYLLSGRMMHTEQDCAGRAAAAALGENLPGSREKRPRGGLTTLPTPALPAGRNRAGQDTKTQQGGGGARST